MSDACCGAAGQAGEESGAATPFWQGRTAQAAAASGLLLGVGLAASAAGADALALGTEAAALGVGGWTFVPEAARRLVRGRLGVGALMSIAAVGAVLLGETAEAASLAFLFSISEALEHYALGRTRQGLRALLALVPDRALVRRHGVEAAIDPAELRPGDLLVVRPGERLATDGVVRAGRSTLDQSAITGESVPVECGPGQTVLAASINGGGVLEVEVTAATAENSLARIVHIVEEAQEAKGAGQRLAERIARPLVPTIMVVAALVALVGSLAGDPGVWVSRALVMLVAAAPCAFALSVPVTVVAAVGAATRRGALIKGGAALEALAGVRVVALDKTGTLTGNRPAVIDVLTVGAATREQVLGTAAALEAHSEHPLASSILDAAPACSAACDVEAVVGQGLIGTVDGATARLGKPGFVDGGELIGEVTRLQDTGASVVLVAAGGVTLGAIAVRDELRPEAASVIRALRGLGVQRVAMLTGDNRRTAEALGVTSGVDTVQADLSPEDKARIVAELRAYGPVAMVGDGINDAPALATADVGVAMAAVGADVAIQAADVAIMGHDLTHLPAVLGHARRAGRIMVQNLLLSGVILVVLIPLAAAGILGLATVVAAHELAEVVVVANGVRAGRSRAVAPLRTSVAGEPVSEKAAVNGACEETGKLQRRLARFTVEIVPPSPSRHRYPLSRDDSGARSRRRRRTSSGAGPR